MWAEMHHGIAYADWGQGPPLLILHGAGGGTDQGALLAAPLRNKMRFIIPSRFGYLRSPLSGKGSPTEQADALVDLLDYLEISETAVLGASAGGLSALQFALRHPERCTALVLVSALSHPLSEATANRLHTSLSLLQAAPASQFLIWSEAVTRGFLSLAESAPLVGALPAWQFLLHTPGMIPYHLRFGGTLNDMAQIAALETYPLDEIAVPTLVVHGTVDRLVPFSQGESAAERIPGARLLTIEGGGHYCYATHSRQIGPELRAFLSVGTL